MGEEPMVRASIPKSSWLEISRSPPAQRERIERALGPDFERELNQALAVSWVPFRIETRIADAAYEALGPAAARAFYRRKTMHSFDIPWLRPLVASTLRMFGATPNSVLKMLPRTWSTLSRNCGSYQFVDEKLERRGVSVIRGFPTALYRRKEAWLESISGGYEGFFDFFKLEGTVDTDELDLEKGNGRFILQW